MVSFGQFTFDPSTHELRRSGRPIALAPLPSRLLARLLDAPGELVTREQLADYLWGSETYVDASAGLNTAVRQIRLALGDTAEASVFVATVPRRGYRFIAPMAAAASNRRGGYRGSSLTPVPMAAAGVLLLAAGGLVAFLASHRDDSRTASVGGAAASSLEIQVVTSGTDELGLLTLSFADEVRKRLAEPAPSLAALNVPDAESIFGRGDFGLRLAMAPGEWPGHARLEAQLMTAGPPGSDLALLRASVALDSFDSIRGRLARDLVKRAELAVAAFDEGHTSPSNSEAWLLYLDALDGMAVACNNEGPVALLERSLRLDPDFAPAWYLLSGARFLEANLCSGGQADYELAGTAARRAAELAPAWPEPIQLDAGILLHQGRVDDAMSSVAAARERFPDEPLLQLRQAEILRYAGLLESSSEIFHQVLEDEPWIVLQSDIVAYPYLYGEEWDRFLEILPARTSPFFRYYRGWAEAQRGNVEAAKAALAPAFEEDAGDSFSRLAQALLAVLDGKSEEARVTLHQLARQRQARGVGDGEVSFKIGQLLLQAGDTDGGLDQLELAIEQGFFCVACLKGSGTPGRLRGSDRYLTLLAEAERRRAGFARRFELAS